MILSNLLENGGVHVPIQAAGGCRGGHPVLKESLNLPCWRVDTPSGNMPAFSELATIRPHRKFNEIAV